MTSDGEHYRLEDLNKDQFKVAYVILTKIREWLRLANASEQEKKRFKPLRMTVLGCGGTGKSVLINTIVSCIRKIFQDNNSILVAAPTGCAAYNVGGKTIHKQFNIRVRGKKDEKMGNIAREELMKKLLRVIAIMFDERSMIGQIVIGGTELNVSETCHNGGHESEDWGGVPVVALFGDDYQLSSPGLGAFDALFNQGNNKASRNGAQQFIKLGNTTMELKKIMRQNKKQKQQLRLLKHIRVGNSWKDDVDLLMSLHLNNTNFTEKDIEEINKKAMYIFANKNNMNEHNRQKLKEEHSKSNPIAKIPASTTSRGITYKGIAKCMRNETSINSSLNVCRGAKVQISGKNFEPDWGLYNGAVGEVIEIVFQENENPLDGTHPQYIVVDFPQYRGPAWINEKPTWVPIPPIEITCQKHCCNLRYIPLSLSYAKTGHTFQGQSVGPHYAISCIVVHPGNKGMELLCPGLLYMFLSRAATIGTPSNRKDSAIFFCSNEMNEDRITNLTITREGKICKKVQKRNKWIKYLNQHKHDIKISSKQKQNLIDWVNTTTIDTATVNSILNDKHWRKSELLNY